MKVKHMDPQRAAAVMFEGKHLTLRESNHLRSSEHCHGWVIMYGKLARLCNITIEAKIPELGKLHFDAPSSEVRPPR